MNAETLERLRAIFKDVPSVVIEETPDGIVLGCNDEKCEFAFNLVDARYVD